MDVEKNPILDEIFLKYPYYKSEQSNNSDVKVSRDCDFNFSPKHCEKFKKLLSETDDIEKEEVLRELEKCKKRYHQVCNFSLMPVTGAMQHAKRNVDQTDGVDSFLKQLKMLYGFVKDITVKDCLNELENDYKTQNRESRLRLLKGLKFNKDTKERLIVFFAKV